MKRSCLLPGSIVRVLPGEVSALEYQTSREGGAVADDMETGSSSAAADFNHRLISTSVKRAAIAKSDSAWRRGETEITTNIGADGKRTKARVGGHVLSSIDKKELVMLRHATVRTVFKLPPMLSISGTTSGASQLFVRLSSRDIENPIYVASSMSAPDSTWNCGWPEQARKAREDCYVLDLLTGTPVLKEGVSVGTLRLLLSLRVGRHVYEGDVHPPVRDAVRWLLNVVDTASEHLSNTAETDDLDKHVAYIAHTALLASRIWQAECGGCSDELDAVSAIQHLGARNLMGVLAAVIVPTPGGAMVTAVHSGCESELGGLDVGDVIICVDDFDLSAIAGGVCIDFLLRGIPGELLQLTVVRNGAVLEIEMELQDVSRLLAWRRRQGIDLQTEQLMHNALFDCVDP